MMNLYCGVNNVSNMAAMLAEDAGAPELRNPRNSAMRARGWFARLFRRGR